MRNAFLRVHSRQTTVLTPFFFPSSLCRHHPIIVPLGDTATTQAVTHRQSDSPAVLINERSTYSAFRRAFAFHEPLDPSTVKARLEHGQLRVSVQKKEQLENEGVVDIQVE